MLQQLGGSKYQSCSAKGNPIGSKISELSLNTISLKMSRCSLSSLGAMDCHACGRPIPEGEAILVNAGGDLNPYHHICLLASEVQRETHRLMRNLSRCLTRRQQELLISLLELVLRIVRRLPDEQMSPPPGLQQP